jgi:NAD(P)H-flavin reductase
VDQALATHCPALAGHELYCCGAPGMVNAVRDMAVQRCGLDAADFHADVFVDGPAVSAAQPAAA